MLEKLEQKLAEIRMQKEQAFANYNAICGAEQVLQQLINECEVEENENSDN